MSSTNRGGDRHVSDYYVTPHEPIAQFLLHWLHATLKNTHPVWLDPCAGGDKDHVMSYPTVIKTFGIDRIHTQDIREDSLADTKADYLTTNLDYTPDVIITNPPFALAQQFITKAMQDVANNGYVIMLLRLNFLESKSRKEFFTNNMPEEIYVHHKRLSFTDDCKTDSVAYMHAVWHKGKTLKESKLKII